MATRRERVLLELEDNFSSEMLAAASSTALLKRELNSLSGTSVNTSRDTDRMTQSAKKAGDEIGRTSKKVADGTKDIDRYSGRLRLLTEAIAVIGPASIPIGAAAIPAISALAAGLGVAAGAAGVAMLAFHGVGDALKALETAELEPTTANLDKARAALDALGPAGAHFARYLQSLRPALSELQDTARAGLFPGLEEGISNLMPLLPQVERIIDHIARTMGSLGADAGSALASDRFRDFFDYLETDAGPILHAFAVSTGNVAEGLGHLTVAFAPLTRDFTGGMERMTASFAHWADGLSQTQGFRDFVQYVHDAGPQVVAFMGALGNAAVGIVHAMAPMGTVVLPALTALLNVIGAIGNSSLGAPFYTGIAAALAFNRALSITNAGLRLIGTNATVAGSGMMSARVGAAGLALALMSVVAAGSDTATALGKVRTEIALGDLDAAKARLNDLNEQIAKFQDFRTTSGFKDQLSDMASVFTDFSDALYFTGSDVAGGGIEGMRDQAKLLKKQIADLEASSQAGAGAMEQYSTTVGRAGAAAGLTSTEIKGLDDAMQENRNTALSAFDAVTQYGEALAAARKQAKSSDAGINANTEAGRKNRQALSQLAAAWNQQGDSIKNNVGKWRQARSDFIQTAVAMGVPIAKAKQLAADILDIPKSRLTKITADTSGALAGINNVRNALGELRDKTIHVTTIRYGTSVVEPHAQITRAAGGPIVGPGTKTSDSVPVLASNGEFMMSAAAVDHYGLSTMFAMNARRLADGGPVSGAKSAMREFNLHGGMTPKDVRDEFRAFAHDLHKAGFVLGKAFDHLRGRSERLAGQIAGEVKARDALKERRSDLLSSASGVFTHDAFGGGLGDLTMQLEADTNDYRHGQAALKKAKRRGLDGPLAEELAKSGNLALIDQIARSTPSRIHQIEQMLQARSAAASGFGHTAVDVSGLQRQIDLQNRLIAKQNRVLAGLEHAVESGAHRGTKAGAEGREKRRNRESANRGRT